MTVKKRIDRGSLGISDEGYSVHINITPADPLSECMDYLDFKNFREFVKYLTKHGEELLDKMEECDVEVVFRSKDVAKNKLPPWRVSLWEDRALVVVDIEDLESGALKDCQERLAKIRELARW